jgi:hypothetical protein
MTNAANDNHGGDKMMGTVAKLLALTIAGVIVGLPLGLWRGNRPFDEGAQIMADAYALGEYEILAALQYKQSIPESSKQAQLDLLQFMQQMEVANKQSLQPSIEGDRSFAYMRLALLEEKGGNMESSRVYFQKAQESLKRRRSNDASSEEHLRDMIAKFDSTSHYLLPFMLEVRKRMR